MRSRACTMSRQSPAGLSEPGKMEAIPTIAMDVWIVVARGSFMSTSESSLAVLFEWPRREMKGGCRHRDAMCAQLVRAGNDRGAFQQIQRDLGDRPVGDIREEGTFHPAIEC